VEQVFRGMAGLFVVRSRTDPVPATIEERLLVISDMRLAADGTIPANTAMDWQNGREGNYVLVNGQYRPALTINPGQSQRWRILNATNARYLRLALTGHTLTLIGTDGGLLRSPVPGLDEILLAPAERVEAIVTASLSAGASAVLQCLPYKRGGMGGGMMSFLIDGKTFDPARIDLTSTVHELEQWTIENRSSMDHPFHLHGTQFQVVSRTRSGVTATEPYLAWRDTVNVAASETVVFNVVQQAPGKRMYHCHILGHESQGMMGVLEVVA
jgi:FtsP/CotA-like multicopper oxidase with cupredoxin domain